MYFPKLRSDLIVSRQESASGPLLVIKDPVTADYFRLRELERFIVERCDGATPADAIREQAEQHFGAPLPQATFRNFLATLRGAGLLEGATVAVPRRRAGASRIAGPLMYLRFRLFNPDRLFGWLVPRLRLGFTPGFLALVAVSIVLAAAITIGRWTEIGEDFFRVFRPQVIPLLVLVVLSLSFAHECAHGLTCKWFGGEVPELGFMLIYFQPAMYCNVSDAWLFPEKSRRMWVGFAGPFFELFLWSLATLAWRAFDSGTEINTLAYIAMAASGIKTLLNFNPLLKLDGYYLLSDLLDTPNLRRRAFGHIGSWLKRLATGERPPGELDPREGRIILAYGIAAVGFSLGVLAAAFARFGHYLLQHDQPLGLVFLGGVLGFKVRRRIRRLFPKPADLAKDAGGDGIDNEAPTDAPVGKASLPGARPSASAAPGAAAAPGTASPSRASRRGIVLLAVAGVAAALAFAGRWELKIRGPLLVLPVQNADVHADVDGVVADLEVREGDRVKRGDLIARLSDRDLEADLAKTEADIDQARARLALLEAGPRPEELAVARAEVAKADRHFKLAHERLAMDQAVFDSLLISRRDLMAAQEEAATAENDLAEARSKLELLRKGSRPEDIAATRAELRGLESRRRLLEDESRHLNVLSPATGIVATPSAQLRELENRLVHRGDLLAKVFDCTTLTAEIPVSEHDISDVHVGSAVLIKARAYPDRTFHGVVTAVATATEGFPASEMATAGSAPVRVVTSSPGSILVTTEIDNRALLLKPGMTGEAKILAGRRSTTQLLTRWLSHSLKVEFWSWS
ncbi:MAG TPA: HlyD family efflux transporter periplasmic adaptor subunit [Candidatus Eisenbacteria bacterium]